MEFRCRLGTPGGEVIEGIYIADNEARLRREFEEKGLFVLSLQSRARPGRPVAHARNGRARLGHRSFWSSTKSWPRCSRPGCRWSSRSTSCAQRVSNPTFKAVLDSVHDKVKAGSALSDSFAEHGSLFPAVYSASLLAGERSGNLEQVIRRYVGYEKIVGAVRRRTISALIYPAILVTMMIVLVGIIVIKVVPSFSEFYANFGRQLPLSDAHHHRASRTSSTSNLWLIVLLVVGGVVGAGDLVAAPGPSARSSTRRSCASRGWARRRASSPPRRRRGRWRRCSAAASRSCRRSTSRRDRCRTVTWPRSSTATQQRVQEGQSFAVAMGERGVFPDVAVKMVEVGESTGALQEMLNSLADFYDEEIDTEVERFIKLIEPALLVHHGPRHRRGRAGALHAALRAGLARLGHARDMATSTDPAKLTSRPDDAVRRGRARAQARRAVPPRVRRHGRVPDQPGTLPRHPGRPDAALRVRAVPQGGQRARHRRLRPDQPPDDRRGQRRAEDADQGDGRRAVGHPVDPQEERELAARPRQRQRGPAAAGAQGRQERRRRASPSSG